MSPPSNDTLELTEELKVYAHAEGVAALGSFLSIGLDLPVALRAILAITPRRMPLD
jgi:hypothetical protein